MTPDAEREALERRIRASCEAGEKQQAATALLEGYGREILAFLIVRLRDRSVAEEVFSRFTEDLWRGLDGFGFRCSARVWAYTLARNAASHHLRDERKHARAVPLSGAGPLSAIAERIRTETQPSARTGARDQLARLREDLSDDDQLLLVLRLNRKLSWTEIAQVMFHDGEVADAATLQRESVRLRKRYQSVKDRLRELARAAGLVPAGEE